MASFNNQTIWFKGTFNRYYASRDTWEMKATTLIHDVDFNEATGTITVNPVTHFKSWSAIDETITEYPGVSQSKNWYGGSDQKVIFCGNSSLVLTPKNKTAAQATCGISPMKKDLQVPGMKVINIQENKRTLRK